MQTRTKSTLRLLSLLLALLLALSALPVQSVQAATVYFQSRSYNFLSGYTLTGDQAQDMISIAFAQEGRRGYQFDYTEHWCADFVSDCAKLAGATGPIPGHCNCGVLKNNILEVGGWHSRSDPRPGDICFFNWDGNGSLDHVEIVYQVSGSTVYTIGGNNGSGAPRNSMVYKHSYPVSDQRIDSILRPKYRPTHTHSYNSVVTAPTCTAQGFTTHTCSCGDSYVDSYVPALGHSWDNGVITRAPSCQNTGIREFRCTRCGETTTEVIPSTDHDWVYSRYVAPTCAENGFTEFRCSHCGKTTEKPDQDGYSAWSDQYPTDIPGDRIEKLTQYRHKTHQTVTSEKTELPGYVREGDGVWQTPESGSISYVASWPDGFSREHPLYARYSNSPKSAGENETLKTVITSDEHVGWIYWHWCQNSYANGPINRFVNEAYVAGKYTGFHAFYSTSDPSGYRHSADDHGGYVCEYPNADCCKDSHWYWPLEVRTQHYTVSRKLYTYGRWGEWSQWDTWSPAPGPDYKVESRTLYRWRSPEATDHTWNDGVVSKKPTCAEEGVKTFTCTVCGATRTEAIPKLAHTWNNGVVTTEPTYQTEGVKTFTCSVCGKTRTEAVPRKEAPFRDVPADEYFHDPVIWAVENGITNGFAPGLFAPERTCTRAQAVTFLWRAAGKPAPRRGSVPFTDVPKDEYFHDAVAWAVENEITLGMGNNTFDPERTCTRAQIVTFLWRAQGRRIVNSSNPFRDVPDGEYFCNPVLWAVENGITNGMGDGLFCPERDCTRAQIVTFLYRSMNR